MGAAKSRSRLLRKNDTKAEHRLWQELRNRQLSGWKFRRQHPIGRYVVAFVALSAKLIVEVDGATHSTNSEVAYDEERTRSLEGAGFRVIRFTNTDIAEDLIGVLNTILWELRTAGDEGPSDNESIP